MKIQFHGYILLMISIGTLYEEKLQNTNQQEFRIEKVTKEKVINYMSNGKL